MTVPQTATTETSDIEHIVRETTSEDSSKFAEEKLEGAPPQFDAHFLLSILDPREIVVPITLKKVFWWIALVACISGITYNRGAIISGLKQWAQENSIPLMLVLYLYEPLLYALEIITTPKYPEALPETVKPIPNLTQLLTTVSPLNHPRQHHDLAVVIPCHNSAEFIADTINAALCHVPPNHIFLMDNGRELLPTDNTKRVAHDIHPGINYFWLPKIASKNWAQLFALKHIKEFRQELSLVLIIDDDTRIPPNFSIRRDFLLDPGVQAIAYPIRAISPYQKTPRAVKWQDHEYVKADLHKLSLDQDGVLDCAHGAAAVIRIEALWKILMLRHNGKWYGEDLRNGYELEGGWRLDLNCYFNTTVPQTILGKPLNLYQQRVRAWDQALLLFCWSLVLKPLLTMRKGSLLATLKLKNSQLYGLYSALMQIFRYPLIGLVASTPNFWGILAAIKMVDLLLGLIFNYLKLPPYLRGDLLTVITFPIYKELLSIMGSLSFFRALFITGPITDHPRSLGFQLGHGQVRMDQESMHPRSADDDTIIAHLIHLREIHIEAQNLLENHTVAITDNPIHGENINCDAVYKKIRDWDRETAGLNAADQDDIESEDTSSVRHNSNRISTHSGRNTLFQTIQHSTTAVNSMDSSMQKPIEDAHKQHSTVSLPEAASECLRFNQP